MATTERPAGALRRWAVLGGAIVAIGLCAAAPAIAGPDLADVRVVDRDTGRPLPVWRHDGRLFVAGEPGERYSLRLSNHTGGRVLVVVSVDGVNIITGETARAGQRGYVLDAYRSYDVTGWRKSETEVAAFAFAPLPQSYAARTGRPGDVGVIGLAAFRERARVPPPEVEDIAMGRRLGAHGRLAAPPPPPPPPAPVTVTAERAAHAPAAAGQPADDVADRRLEEKLGTAHGAREWSVSRTVAFERATPYPQTVMQIEYDTYANLVAAGVIPAWTPPQHRPRPFPSTPDGAGYVPDPPREP